ncbi:MAG: hypothetical protein GY701_08840 [Sulfitobacter sp.]|nr:hypothetical protein [Sulfitobacter sp.]
MSSLTLWRTVLARMFRHAPFKFGLLLPLSLVAVLSRILVSGAVLTFLAFKLQEGKAQFRVAGAVVTPSSLLSSDRHWVVLIAVLSIANVILTYGERVFQLILGRSFSIETTRRALSEVGQGRTELGFDPGMLVRGSAAVVGSVAPVAKLIALAGVLVWLRWELALVLLAITAVAAVPLQVRLRRRIVDVGAQRRGATGDFKRATKEATARLKETTDDGHRNSIISEYLESYPLVNRVRSGLEVREAQQRSVLVGGFASAAGMIGLVVAIAMAGDDDAGRASLLGLVLFVIVLQMFYGASRELLSRLATYHKHEHGLAQATDGHRPEQELAPGRIVFVYAEPPGGDEGTAEWLASLDLTMDVAPRRGDATGAQASRSAKTTTSSEGQPIRRQINSVMTATSDASPGSETSGVSVAAPTPELARVIDEWTSAALESRAGVVVAHGSLLEQLEAGDIRSLMGLVQHHNVVVASPDGSGRAAIESALGHGVPIVSSQEPYGEDEGWE